MHRLIHTYPDRDSSGKNAEIAVEKPNFSTFSTGFSTAGFHRMGRGGISKTVYINLFDRMRQISHFPGLRLFDEGEETSAKYGA